MANKAICIRENKMAVRDAVNLSGAMYSKSSSLLSSCCSIFLVASDDRVEFKKAALTPSCSKALT